VADPDKLLKYKLSINQLYQALQENNANTGGGFIERNAEQFIVRGVGLIGSEEDIRNIVLKTHNESHGGIPTFVGDVAVVRTGFAPRQGMASQDVKGETVGGIVMMLKGENSLAVLERIEKRVREINQGTFLPPMIKITPYYVRSAIVNQSIRTVSRTLLEGALLVVVVLYLLLRNVRGAMAVILALPLSLLLTFIVMKGAGLTANLMSLGGLAISIGMIIDATIIQVENVQRHLALWKEGDSKRSLVLKAVLEVRKPSMFGELIIALAFIPILALQGMEGKMFAPLAITVAIALFVSLLLSIFVVPVLCLIFLRPGDEKPNRLLRGITHLYTPMIQAALKRPALVFMLSLVLLSMAGLLIPRLGTEFMPIMDEGAFDMDIQLLPGVSLDKAGEITQLVHQRMMQFPELITLISRTGQTGISLEARGVDKTGFTGMLRPREEWTSAGTKPELISRMRGALAGIPGMAFSFSQPIQCRIDELVAGTRAQVIVKLFGSDMGTLKAKIEAIARILSTIRGAADLVVEKVSGQPYIAIQIDRKQIARYGINVSDVLKVIEIAIGGKAATQFYEENRTFDLTVRLEENRRNSLEKMCNLLIRAPDGVTVPLDQLAGISMQEGPVQISRENGQRRIGVEFNVTGRDIGSFVAEAQRKIQSQVFLPAGYSLSWGGQFENQQAAMHRLLIIAPIVGLLILFLLYVTFHSARLAALAFLNLPFALLGGVLALWTSRLYLSVPASVGFIVLFGVAVLNGLVLVSYILQLRQEGFPARAAALQACRARLRPILMTATITVFSLIPMLFAAGPGAEIQRPLAIVVVGGLFTSTLSTLLVLPSMYGWLEKKENLSGGLDAI
jgi:cobalt-zinc-cadmium resistance protein CzcA